MSSFVYKLVFLYTFKGRDKLVTSLTYFLFFCIALTIASLITIFSITNGFIVQISKSIFSTIDSQNIPYIVLRAALPSEPLTLEQVWRLNEFNQRLVIPENLQGSLTVQPIKYQLVAYSMNNDNDKRFAFISPSSTIKENQIQLPFNVKDTDTISIFNPNEINPVVSYARYKQFKPNNIHTTFGYSALPLIKVSPEFFDKFFFKKSALFYAISFPDPWATPNIEKQLKDANPQFSADSWASNSFYATGLIAQKQICYFACFLLAALLSALILAINVAFLKDKRRDFALLEMLGIHPHISAIILSLKAVYSFVFVSVWGIGLGLWIAAHAQELIDLLGLSVATTRDLFFGQKLLTAEFIPADFYLIEGIVGLSFVITLAVQLLIMKRSNLANSLKIGN